MMGYTFSGQDARTTKFLWLISVPDHLIISETAV